MTFTLHKKHLVIAALVIIAGTGLFFLGRAFSPVSTSVSAQRSTSHLRAPTRDQRSTAASAPASSPTSPSTSVSPATSTGTSARPPTSTPTTSAPTTSARASTPAATSSPPKTTEPLPLFTAGSFSGRDPTTIDFSPGCCSTVQNIKWQQWTAAQAQGTGTYEYDTCANGCVEGPFDPYPATITLSGPEGGQFTVLEFAIDGGPQAGVSMWTYPNRWPFDSS